MKAQLIVLPSAPDSTLSPVSSSEIQGICSDGCWRYEGAALSSLTGGIMPNPYTSLLSSSHLDCTPTLTPEKHPKIQTLCIISQCLASQPTREGRLQRFRHSQPFFVGLGPSARICAIFCWHGPTFESNPWYLIKNSIWSICLQKQLECIQIMSILQHVVRPCILLFRAFLELNSLQIYTGWLEIESKCSFFFWPPTQ